MFKPDDPFGDPLSFDVFTEIVDAPETRQNDYVLEVGDQFSGSAAPEDIDYIGLNLFAGHSYVVNYEIMPWGQFSGEIIGIVGPVGGSNPTQVWEYSNQSVIFTPNSTGIHYFLVNMAYSGGGIDYSFTLTSDVPGSRDSTATVEVGGSYLGMTDAILERDWIGTELEVGHSYIIEVEYETSHPSGAILSLLRTSGTSTTLIARNGDLPFEPFQIHATIGPNVGDYWIEFAGNVVGAYTITVVEELANSTSTSESIAPGETYTGVLDYSYDEDWIAIDLENNGLYLFEFDSAAEISPVVAINGNTNSFHDQSFAPVRGYIADRDGAHYIAVAAIDLYNNYDRSNPVATGEYTVGAQQLGAIRDVAGSSAKIVDLSMTDLNVSFTLLANETIDVGAYTALFQLAPATSYFHALTGGGDDAVIGNFAANFIDGGDGDNDLQGLGGHDTLLGGSGDDTLNGGDGFDVLAAGTGVNEVTGGGDADLFVFESPLGQTVVTDFEAGVDVIDLTKLVHNDSAFSFASGGKGELAIRCFDPNSVETVSIHFRQNGNDTEIFAVNGELGKYGVLTDPFAVLQNVDLGNLTLSDFLI